jgi:predicted TIM-barrel enzyme
MAYRRKITAMDVKIVADLRPHDLAWPGGRAVEDAARGARRVGADAVAVNHPDEAIASAAVRAIRSAAPGLPVLLAGHTTHANAARVLAEADGAFVGTCLERDGWGSEIDADRVAAYVKIVRELER